MTMYQMLPAIALVAGLLTTVPAAAQCAFDQSVPNANAVLTEAEPSVSIDFTDEFELRDVRVVSLADSSVWTTDWAPAGEVRSTRFRITRPLPPGRYLIEWNGYLRRHFHADGGSIPFTVAAEGAPPMPAEAPQEGAAPRVGPGSPYRALLGAGAPQPGR